MKWQTQDAEKIPNNMNSKKFTIGHITIKLLKTRSKEKNLKPDRE